MSAAKVKMDSMEVDVESQPQCVDSNKMDIDPDSMSDEEEYVPIDYNTYKGKKRKTAYKRATRNFVVDDQEDIEYQQPTKKKQKTNASSIIKNMKKNKNYDVRSSTKIVTSKPKDCNDSKGNKTSKTKKKPKSKSNRAKSSLGGGTLQLIQQKTTQNSMHCTVSLTVQEKYLKQHYKTIAALLIKNKKQIEKTDGNSFNGMKHLKEAMSNGLNASSTSCNIIIEPGEKGSNTEKTTHGFNETFVKRSTNYIQQRNNSSLNNKTAIDIDYYFNNDSEKDVHIKGTLNEKERMKLNQERALDKLRKMGNTNIGKHNENIEKKEKKFSIKRRKKKIMSNNINNNNNNMMEIEDKVEIHNDKEHIEFENENSLNSGFDNLTNYDYLSSSDRTRVNLQKYELALKAAEDKSSAIDDEMHQENCNVYVGGLHPECDESMLRKLFKHCGDIKQIRLDWRKKGFGFIHYQTHEQAMEAIQDMDGRLIMGQPIKCRWAKSKMKTLIHEQMLKEKEQEKEAMQDGVNLGMNANKDKGMPDDINTNHPNHPNHPNPVYHRSVTSVQNKNNDTGNVTSIGFLSKRKDVNMKHKLINGPPALVKVKKNKDKNANGEEDNPDVEYW